MKKYFIAAIKICSVIFLFTSCSNKIYFTNEMRLKLGEYDQKINDVQFYISKTVVLKKVLPYDSAIIANGQIRFENARVIDNIIIKKNTPGTCEFVEDGLLNVIFEEGENNYLTFKPVLNGKYYELFINRDLKNYGEVFYENERYFVQPGSEKARLWVKKNEYYLLRIQQRVVKGKRVDNKVLPKEEK